MGYALVILGVVMFVFTGISFVPNKKKLVDIGSVKIEREKSHPVQWSPFIGIALVVGGIVLVGPARKIKKLKFES